MSQRKRYPTDLSDACWAKLSAYFPDKGVGTAGRRRRWSRREIVNAIFYVLKSGCAWRLLPGDFPAWQTVYDYFRRWTSDGTWQALHDALREQARLSAGRAASPSAAILDAQTVKLHAAQGLERGYDAGKKTLGRKRHLLVDTLGLIWGVIVHSAGIQDAAGAKPVLKIARKCCPRLLKIWADGAYNAQKLIAWVKRYCPGALEIVSKPKDAKGFVLLPKRWIVERTFGWLIQNRRLAKDYEKLPENSVAFILIAMIPIMLRISR